MYLKYFVGSSIWKMKRPSEKKKEEEKKKKTLQNSFEKMKTFFFQ